MQSQMLYKFEALKFLSNIGQKNSVSGIFLRANYSCAPVPVFISK